MKKFICIIIALLMMLPCLYGCGSSGDDDGVNIVCTVFPIYDWIRNMVGDISGVRVELIIQNGTDPHSYSPTPADIAKISSCDILVYVGGESDAWVADVLRGDVNKDMEQIRLLEVMKDSLIESEEGAHGDERDHDHSETHTDSAYDEHIWLSLKNAAKLCRSLEIILKDKVGEGAESLSVNAEKYVMELEALDAEYAEAVASGAVKTLLFADRFPFGYLTRDYGLEYYAAFEGCSADSEASFETVTFLAKKLGELKLGCVIILESSGKELAETIISSSSAEGVKVFVMDSLQSITETDIKNGVTYLSVMRKNLSVLKEALG